MGITHRVFAISLAALTNVPAIPSYAESSNLVELEERVAELEATAARASANKATVTIYGQVNRAILAWDDGRQQDAYVVDNDVSSTRLGAVGGVRIGGDWTAGYRLEIELRDAGSDTVNQASDEGEGESAMATRIAAWYVESASKGRLTVGQQSPASDDITLINLGASMSDAGIHYNNAFGLRLKSGPITDLTWESLVHTVDTYRGDFVRYDTPLMGGFLVSAAWGENDVWDAAVRHRGAFAGVQFASGLGYMQNDELNFADVRGSASAIHGETGMFISAAAGARDEEKNSFTIANVGDFKIGEDSYFYFLQSGLSKHWLPLGKTSIYGEYGLYNNFSSGSVLRADFGAGLRDVGILLDNEVTRWGFGVEQSIDASATLLYANVNYFSADSTYCPAPWRGCAAGLPNAPTKNQKLPVEDWSGVVLGARIQF
ncbi:MAG: hypothetical protein NW215_14245 [Hyphomicrobiales bacterium]|nr:hypothetical protein [Hyphomicrobiales bacterium]